MVLSSQWKTDNKHKTIDNMWHTYGKVAIRLGGDEVEVDNMNRNPPPWVLEVSEHEWWWILFPWRVHARCYGKDNSTNMHMTLLYHNVDYLVISYKAKPLYHISLQFCQATSP